MRQIIKLLILAIISGVIFIISPFIGMKLISISSIINSFSSNVDYDIFWKIRLPRICIAFISGSALALSGMAFQALFRNPLAEPFTLGVSSGAALGAAIYIQLGISISFGGISGISIFSFLGAILSILLVYSLTRVKKGFSSTTLLLAGVAVSFSFSSLILFIQYISDFSNSFRIIRWLMGGIEAIGFSPVLDILPFFIIGAFIVIYKTQELNLLTMGEEIAISRGVDFKRTQKILFIATSFMVGGVVAICGPIGFVGLIIPHLCRLIIGWNHKYLIPATILFGGMFLTLCDTVARTIMAPAELPVGVITALIGGPFFLWLLLSRKSERNFL